jgi:hypothetical protein
MRNPLFFWITILLSLYVGVVAISYLVLYVSDLTFPWWAGWFLGTIVMVLVTLLRLSLDVHTDHRDKNRSG